VLNQPAFANGSVLFAGPDFGTGSSREHAVWALRDYGFKAVFSSKFADIFRGNSGKQGLVTGVISDAETESIWQALEANPGLEAKVDLVNREVTVGDLTVKFEIDEYTRWRLLEGLDDIGLTLRDEQSITDFEARREPWRPKTLPAKGA
jgi:3-isopropylmalate/(R)-2-methylmalate dehydratase small subunit